MFEVNANIFQYLNNTDKILHYTYPSGSHSGEGCITRTNEKPRDN